MKKIVSLHLLLCFIFFTKVEAQSCFSVNAGNDTTISCLQPCFNLKAHIPSISTSEFYKVASIPYAPLAYTTAGGTTDPAVYADDHFSRAFFLPFPFCFYGSTYNKICVGSNGVITFDASNSNTIEGYYLNPGDKIPFSGGTPNTQATFYAPKASIFLAYYDMNPATSPFERKIEWRVEGIAPCRKFVVSYYHIGNYDVLHCPNLVNLCTMQAILYEGTGLIDVFYENKPSCTFYQGGLAIAGIQNWGQNRATTPPGRNGTAWTAKNEGIRYIPNGPTSLLSRVELYKNGTLISTGSVSSIGNGMLEALFSNICQTEDSMSYVVKAFYKKCDNPAVETEGSDTMIVYKTLNPISVDVANPICLNGTGVITVLSPLGANLEYSSDGGTTWQTSPVFNLVAGSYIITARVIGSLCTGKTSITVTNPPGFSTNGVTTNLLCAGQNTGVVTFNPVGPGTPFDYSDNAGITFQTNNTFNGLAAGSHIFRIRNSAGCWQDTTIIITSPPILSNNEIISQTSCSGTDGTITIVASGGTPAYQYSIDNGVSFQVSNVFNNLSFGNYNLKVEDANGCFVQTSVNVNLVDTMRLSLGADSSICFGSSITLQPQTNALTNIFKWTPSTGLSADSIKNPVATPVDSIKYFLTAKWGYCQRTDSVVINVKHKPIAYAGKDTSICYKTIAYLNGSASNLSGTVNYAWTPAANVNPSNSANAIAKPDTTQLYALTITDNYGCNFSVSSNKLITMQPPVPAFAGNDTIAVLGSPQQLLAGGGVNYLWSPATNLNNPFIANPLATLYNDTYFTVQVTDAVGCIGNSHVFIKVYEGPTYYVPGAFSPNGDGLNDIFRPIPVGIASTESFMVFNRYGELVFQTNQWMKGWDGKYKGTKATAGTYVWKVKGTDKNGRVIEMQGTVILMR